jgi:hypothetical protein
MRVNPCLMSNENFPENKKASNFLYLPLVYQDENFVGLICFVFNKPAKTDWHRKINCCFWRKLIRNCQFQVVRPLTYLLTPWSRVFLEKQTVNFAASQEIPRNYGTRKFLTVPILRLRDTFSRNIPPPLPGDLNGGVLYLRIALSPEEASLHG